MQLRSASKCFAILYSAKISEVRTLKSQLKNVATSSFEGAEAS